jgi:hypothetical protein
MGLAHASPTGALRGGTPLEKHAVALAVTIDDG